MPAGTLTSASVRAFKNNGLPYSVYYPSTTTVDYRTSTNISQLKTVPPIADLLGFDRPISSKFSTGCG